MNELAIPKNEIKCVECHGIGQVVTPFNFHDKHLGHWVLRTNCCLKCHGKGRIDWIKNATGLDNSELYIAVMQHPTTSFEKKEDKNDEKEMCNGTTKDR